MDFKKSVFIFSLVLLFVSIIAASASSVENTHDIQSILENYNESDMTGCCSVVLQMDGNNSMFSFRRDAGNAADIYIEKINWHGKEAIKQYKTSAGYFCQVIITNDGWVIGYGGIDDGDDNKKIENITGSMVNDNNTISESGLEQVQAIKAAYGLGHLLIKAPNGNYGIATADTHFTGKLNPGEYVSIPNKYSFFRSGNIDLNTSDKVEAMANLAISDGFGLTRRDVTTFNFECGNESNVTDVYLSNDDGSMWGMSTGGLCDNVNFTGKYIKAEDIPIAPKYSHLGNVTFSGENQTNNANATVSIGGTFDYISSMFVTKLVVILLVIIAFVSYHIVRVSRYRQRYRR